MRVLLPTEASSAVDELVNWQINSLIAPGFVMNVLLPTV